MVASERPADRGTVGRGAPETASGGFLGLRAAVGPWRLGSVALAADARLRGALHAAAPALVAATIVAGLLAAAIAGATFLVVQVHAVTTCSLVSSNDAVQAALSRLTRHAAGNTSWCTALTRACVRAAQVSAEARSVFGAAAEALPHGWPHGAGASATTQVHTRVCRGRTPSHASHRGPLHVRCSWRHSDLQYRNLQHDLQRTGGPGGAWQARAFAGPLSPVIAGRQA